MRLFDRVGPQIFDDWEAAKRETTVVEVSNVARWFYTDPDQKLWRLDEDFPSLLLALAADLVRVCGAHEAKAGRRGTNTRSRGRQGRGGG